MKIKKCLTGLKQRDQQAIDDALEQLVDRLMRTHEQRTFNGGAKQSLACSFTGVFIHCLVASGKEGK